ncbi:hypothetical protein SVAN01_08123 [Stagonosporopsis vannaccii]|nr:hypothetical protein SVAN01_08123 [Stagonosporopsis vannaccii]
MVHDAVAEKAQHGAASDFGFNPKFRQPWPLVTYGPNHKYRVLKYCYTNKATRDEFHCRIQRGLTVWADKLGGFPTADKGYNLASLEARNTQGQTEFCVGADGKSWNPMVEPGTLWISENVGSPWTGRATIGYDVTSLDKPDRHYLTLGAMVGLATIVHEASNLQNKRPDGSTSSGDEYLLYQCQNLGGYYDALARAMKEENMNAQDASTKLCGDWDFARKFQFFGVEYIKNPKGYMLDDGEFDVQSIMLYDTGMAASTKCMSNIMACPLLQYVKGGDKTSGLMRIPLRTEPSARDIEWVKKWYPWVA